jgi:hypothetical protein
MVAVANVRCKRASMMSFLPRRGAASTAVWMACTARARRARHRFRWASCSFIFAVVRLPVVPQAAGSHPMLPDTVSFEIPDALLQKDDANDGDGHTRRFCDELAGIRSGGRAALPGNRWTKSHCRL